MHPRKFVRDSIGFAVSQYLVRALITLRGLVAARILGPSGYGAWNAIMLLLEYGVHSPLGTLSGLDVAIPARIVDGDAARLERVKRSGLFNILTLSTLFAAGGVLYFARSSGQVRAVWGLDGVIVVLACVLLTNLSSYHLSLMRSHGDIAAASAWFLLQGSIGVALGLALMAPLGVWGLLWGWLAGTVVAAAMVMWRGRSVVPLTPLPSRESLNLILSGFPMFIYIASSFVMRNLDRVLVLRYLGTADLGLYGLGVMSVGFLMTLPDAVTYVLYPQVVRRFRGAGDAPEAIRELVHRVMRALSLLMPALCGIAYLVAQDTVLWVLPKFRGGVPALRILCFGGAALALANPASVVLMTLGRQILLVPAAIGLGALAVTLDLLAIRWGYGIRGVAWTTFITFSLNSAVLIWLADAGLRLSRPARAGFLARVFLPLLAAISLAYALDRSLPWGDSVGPVRLVRLLIALPAFLAIYGLLAVPLARGVGLKQLASEIRWTRSGPHPTEPGHE